MKVRDVLRRLGEDGWYHVRTTGRTLEETRLHIKEAIEGHLAVMQESGETIPEPTCVADTVQIAA